MDFSKILVRGLKKRCWSCEQLSRETDLTARAIQYYARGEREPSLNNANDILTALGMTIIIGIDGWISVKDRLPKEEGLYLVVEHGGLVGIARFGHGCSHFDDGEYITHWMPLPEAPKEEQP